MAARGAPAAGLREGHGNVGGRGRGNAGGARLNEQAAQRVHATRGAVRLNPELAAPLPEATPPIVDARFMQNFRAELVQMRRELEEEVRMRDEEEEELRRLEEEEELSDDPADLNYEEEEEDPSEEESVLPEVAVEESEEEWYDPEPPPPRRGPPRQHARREVRRARLPSDESINRVAPPRGAEQADPSYDELADRLREFEQVEQEREARLRKLEKDMRAQKGEESEDELEAL